MSHTPPSPSSPPSQPAGPERRAWDTVLKPAQSRAQSGRADLEQRQLADARQQRLISAWLRELANR